MCESMGKCTQKYKFILFLFKNRPIKNDQTSYVQYVIKNGCKMSVGKLLYKDKVPLMAG